MSEEEIKDVIDYVESICNGICSTEEEGLEIKRYIEQLQQENKELKEKLDRINKKLLELPISKHSEQIRLEVKKIIDGDK